MKKIAVLNDLSGLGRCSLTAAIPVISSLGIECCPVPTAILSNQTGFDSFYSFDCTDFLDSFTDEWKKLGVSFDGILTGYFASSAQAKKIMSFLREFRKEGTLFFCDPVMADDGIVYGTYNKELCEAVKTLALSADIISPNLTELCILADKNYEDVKNYDEKHIAEIALSLLNKTLKTVIVTGIRKDGCILNIVAEKDGFNVVKSETYGGSYSGTGDLFSAAVCGLTVNGKSPIEATKTAVSFLECAIKNTYSEKTDRNYGVNFEKYLERIL